MRTIIPALLVATPFLFHFVEPIPSGYRGAILPEAYHPPVAGPSRASNTDLRHVFPGEVQVIHDNHIYAKVNTKKDTLITIRHGQGYTIYGKTTSTTVLPDAWLHGVLAWCGNDKQKEPIAQRARKSVANHPHTQRSKIISDVDK